MPLPPPLPDSLNTEMRLTAVLEMLDAAVRALRETVDEISGTTKSADDAAGADLTDQPEA